MCTVSIIPFLASANVAAAHFSHASNGTANWPGLIASNAGTGRPIGFRLVTNRDELRSRPPAVDPRWHDFTPDPANGTSSLPNRERAIYPIDPAGGGTWIGGSTSGLVLCILNGNPIPAPVLPPREQLLSRGVIIPRLFSLAGASRSLTEVFRRLDVFDLMRFAPFRLIAVAPSNDPCQQGFAAVEASWNRSELVLREHAPGPACFVSSGLGDPLVKPRIALFNRMVRAARGPLTELAAEQDRFHRHTWADRAEISVLMHRREARTVSITSVEVVPSAEAGHADFDLSLEYEPIADRPASHAAAALSVPASLPKCRVTVPARAIRQAQ